MTPIRAMTTSNAPSDPWTSSNDEPAWQAIVRANARRETIRRHGESLLNLLRSKHNAHDAYYAERFNDRMVRLEAETPDVREASLNHADRSGRTPLIAAARHGSAEQVRRLLAAGALTQAQDTDGWTALHHAVHRLDGSVVRTLLAMGADATARVPQGSIPQARTALHLLVARASGFQPEADLPDVIIATLLVNAGCDPESPDAKGHPPLHYLARQTVPTRAALQSLLEMYAFAKSLDEPVGSTTETARFRPRL